MVAKVAHQISQPDEGNRKAGAVNVSKLSNQIGLNVDCTDNSSKSAAQFMDLQGQSLSSDGDIVAVDS